MAKKTLDRLRNQHYATLTLWEQLRLVSALLREDPTCQRFRQLAKHELPLCGARCRDGHPCQARAVRDVETGCFVRNGRCRIHGGLSTGARTPEGKQRIRDALHRRAQERRNGRT